MRPTTPSNVFSTHLHAHAHHRRAPPRKAWVEARKASDFAKFAPFLKEWIEVRREQVRQYLGGWRRCPGKEVCK